MRQNLCVFFVRFKVDLCVGPVTHLLGSIRLVAADSLAAVEVGVDAGIDLVQHVGLVRASGVRRRAGRGAVAQVGALSGSGVGASSPGVGARVSAVDAMGGAVDAVSSSGSSGSGSAHGVKVGVVVVAGGACSGSNARSGAGGDGVATGVAKGTGVASGINVASSAAVEEGGILTNGAGGSSAVRVHAHVSAAITIRIDARVGRVHHVGGVRTISASSWAGGATVKGSGVSSTASSNASVAESRSLAANSMAGVVLDIAASANSSSALRVDAHVLAVVAIRVDARIHLVQHVGLVRTVSLWGRPISASVVAGESSAANAGTTQRVDAAGVASGASGAMCVVVTGCEGIVSAGSAASYASGGGVVDARLGMMRCAGAVGAVCVVGIMMSVMGGGLILVGMKSFLDLVDDGRHDCGVLCFGVF